MKYSIYEMKKFDLTNPDQEKNTNGTIIHEKNNCVFIPIPGEKDIDNSGEKNIKNYESIRKIERTESSEWEIFQCDNDETKI